MIDSDVKNISFFKMHGLGNDFVVIDSRLKSTNLTANFIKKLGSIIFLDSLEHKEVFTFTLEAFVNPLQYL